MDSSTEYATPRDNASATFGGSGRVRRAVAICSWLYSPVVLSAWALIEAGDSCWPATLLMFAPRWFLALPLIPLLLLAAWRRRRSLPLLFVMFLLVAGPIMGFGIPWRSMTSATPVGPRLRVWTFNIHHQRPNREALRQLLDASQPDVVVVQELPSEEPLAYFADPSWHIYRTSGHFLASRYPIHRNGRLGHDSMKAPGSLYRYELETPAGVIALFSLHFASPRDALYEVTHHPVTGRAGLEDNSAVRRCQLENLRRLADESSGPVLLMGDFNTPTESVLFSGLADRYRDAFLMAGWGWGYTFLNRRTTVRIDHIVVGPGWHCERCWVGPNVGPPHRPVLADLIWTGEQGRVSLPNEDSSER